MANIFHTTQAIIEAIGGAARAATKARNHAAIDCAHGGVEFTVSRGNKVRVLGNVDGTYTVESISRAGELMATYTDVSARDLGDVVYTAGA